MEEERTHRPGEAEQEKLMEFLDNELASTTAITSTGSCVQARKIALAQVPLLNVRRWSEASRLLLSDGKDRHSWIDRSQLNTNYKELHDGDQENIGSPCT